MKPTFIIRNADELKNMFRTAYNLADKGLQSGAVVLKLDRESRSLEQNSKLWPMLSDLAKQVEYAGKRRSKDDWKLICFQAWQEIETEHKIEYVPNLSGSGLIMLGCSTSSLNKKEFAALIECIYSIGAQYNVNWSEKAIDYFAEYGIY